MKIRKYEPENREKNNVACGRRRDQLVVMDRAKQAETALLGQVLFVPAGTDTFGGYGADRFRGVTVKKVKRRDGH